MVNIKLMSFIGLLALAIIGYGLFNIVFPEYEKPDMKGSILNISSTQQDYNGDIIGSIFVEGIDSSNQSTKFYVTINKETGIFEQQNNEIHSITYNALKKGQNVEIKFTGPILESYPAQATADRIVILK